MDSTATSPEPAPAPADPVTITAPVTTASDDGLTPDQRADQRASFERLAAWHAAHPQGITPPQQTHRDAAAEWGQLGARGSDLSKGPEVGAPGNAVDVLRAQVQSARAANLDEMRRAAEANAQSEIAARALSPAAPEDPMAKQYRLREAKIATLTQGIAAVAAMRARLGEIESELQEYLTTTLRLAGPDVPALVRCFNDPAIAPIIAERGALLIGTTLADALLAELRANLPSVYRG